MKKTSLKVEEAFVIEFDRHEDKRGYFQEVYKSTTYFKPMPNVSQVNLSYSHKNVVRGLHVSEFGKLCTCIRGRLFDVVADVRPWSPTYMKWDAVWLDDKNKKQLYVPPYCAHGFYAAEDDTILLYAQDGIYDPGRDQSINWEDPRLKIEWPHAKQYILSEKDRLAEFLKD